MQNNERNPEFKTERITSAMKKDDSDGIFVLSNLQRMRRIVNSEISKKLIDSLRDTFAGDNKVAAHPCRIGNCLAPERRSYKQVTADKVRAANCCGNAEDGEEAVRIASANLSPHFPTDDRRRNCRQVLIAF